MSEDQLILVDNNDKEMGRAGKMQVHQQGLMHRAFSIFVFNSNNEMLLQKRASDKYHSAGLWSNTCCSHPRWGEKLEKATHRRLKEEMGFDCPMEKAFHFIYKADFNNGLIEHELDHVFIGRYNGRPKLNVNEAEDWKWIPVNDLRQDIELNPDDYTIWFKISYDRVIKTLNSEEF
ncbi:MAG: isopentenyl-diphosphate Delta-isomerase [Bacteroidales bacterium]|nr:isopentenyl-diphosphate Delta-isomerase [Bacteroidales bacterium]